MKTYILFLLAVFGLLVPPAQAQRVVTPEMVLQQLEQVQLRLNEAEKTAQGAALLARATSARSSYYTQVARQLQKLADAAKQDAADAASLVTDLAAANAAVEAEMTTVTQLVTRLADGPPVPPVTDPPIIDPPVTDPPIIDPPITDPPIIDPPTGLASNPNPVFSAFDVHDAATRTAAYNKAAYLGAKRAGRNWTNPRERVFKTYTFSAGQAPDMGDLDILAQWQWAVNSGRFTNDPTVESTLLSGNIDLARLTIQPHPTWQSTPKKVGNQPFITSRNMRWGGRRYCLGDITVIDCEFSNIPEEHGMYDSITGHALYRGNTFKDLGGQALQLVNRDVPYSQYPPDNPDLTHRAIWSIEDCHAVDVGRAAAKRAFAWSFFDPGDYDFPATIIIRDSTVVSDYPAVGYGTNQRVPDDTFKAVKSSKGLVVTQYTHTGKAGDYTVENLVVDNCLFDLTMSEGSMAEIQGVEFAIFNHSTFIARDCRQPWIGIDNGNRSNPSKTIVFQDCISPPGGEVVLWIRNQPVMHNGQPLVLHCPGRRLVVDVATATVSEEPMVRDMVIDLESPLKDRGGDWVPSGITPQNGEVDSIGEVPRTYRRAG